MEIPEYFIVIDDDSTNNMICEFVLKRAFPQTGIKLFTEPETALEYIKGAHEINKSVSTVLFLDINMPSMTGWDFLEVFKDFHEEVLKRFTIYMLSSSVDDRDKEKADLNPFVSGFLSKPLDFESIQKIFNNNDALNIKNKL
jgi:CheY-like chemotaxis protein